MQNDLPEKLTAAFDRVLAEQKRGRLYSLRELLNELHRDMAGDPEDRTASTIIRGLALGSSTARSALAVRRLELVVLITELRAASLVKRVDCQLDPDGPARQIWLEEANNVRVEAALEELADIDERLA